MNCEQARIIWNAAQAAPVRRDLVIVSRRMYVHARADAQAWALGRREIAVTLHASEERHQKNVSN